MVGNLVYICCSFDTHDFNDNHSTTGGQKSSPLGTITRPAYRTRTTGDGALNLNVVAPEEYPSLASPDLGGRFMGLEKDNAQYSALTQVLSTSVMMEEFRYY